MEGIFVKLLNMSISLSVMGAGCGKTGMPVFD